jgi:hypothetical protein
MNQTTWTAARSAAIPISAIAIVMVVTVATKIEHVEEIADGRAVEQHIGIIFMRDRIRQIVSAARGQRLEPPIALDEFHDRNKCASRVRHARTARLL